MPLPAPEERRRAAHLELRLQVDEHGEEVQEPRQEDLVISLVLPRPPPAG
jgi:hypothetical protein